MRKRLSNLVIARGSLLHALKRIPGFGFCARSLGGRILPVGYRAWFQVQDGIGKGIWLKLNPRTGSQYYRGQADADLQAVLQENLRSGMVFYDLGANNGFFSLLAARIVGPTGRVVTFEVDPRLGIIAGENIDRNGAHNVRLVKSAVWSSTGFVDFSPAEPRISPDLGLGKVVPHPTAETVGVPAVCLDDFVQTERPPDLIKCDVEGAEVEVLRGARKVLTEYRPCFECEIHSPQNGKLLCTMLRDMNYEIKQLSVSHLFAVPSHLPSRPDRERARCNP